MTLPLACTVRGCGLALERRERTFSCPRGHAYDIARTGYVNLLQPQDRRSTAAGDAAEAVAARRRLLEAGIGRAALEAFVARAAARLAGDADVVVDLGAGGGDALAALHARRPIPGIGIDLSTAAADLAARRFPALTWVVANADRRLPLLDGSVALMLSLHARRNPEECRRVLRPGGRLLVAVPAADDLVELRTSVLGQRVERPREEVVLAEHTPRFHLEARAIVREQHDLGRELLLDLLRGTYRGARASAAERIAALERLRVTVASEMFLFAASR